MTVNLPTFVKIVLDTQAVHVEDPEHRRSGRKSEGSKLKIYMPFFRIFYSKIDWFATNFFEKSVGCRVGCSVTGWLSVDYTGNKEKCVMGLNKMFQTLPGFWTYLPTVVWVRDLTHCRVGANADDLEHPAESLARAARLFRVNKEAHALTMASEMAHPLVAPHLHELQRVVNKWSLIA